ncbi:MAG: tetratricopeptide repeat protein [Cyanobacteria bacterium J06638_22]
MNVLSRCLLTAFTPLFCLPAILPVTLLLRPTPALAQTNTAARRAESLELNNRGQQLQVVGRYDEALELFEQALIIVREIDERQGEGVILNNIGEVYRTLGNYEQALTYLQQSLAVHQEIGDRRGQGVALNNIGLIYEALGQYEDALQYFRQSLTIRQDVGDRSGEGTTLNNMGWVYHALGQYQQALRNYWQSLAITREVGNRRVEGASLHNIGLAYEHLGDYELALDFYQQSLAIRQEIGDRQGEGITLTGIGVVYGKLGSFEQSLRYFQEGLSTSQEIGDRRMEGIALNNIGAIYSNQEQYGQALITYQQSLAIRQDIGDRRGEGTTLNNMGTVYDHLGQYENALDVYQQSLLIFQTIGDRSGEGNALNNIGTVYRKLRNHEQALATYQQSLVISQEIGDRAGEAVTLNNIGFVLEEMEETELAIVFFKQSVNQWETIRDDIRGLDTELQESFTDRVSVSYRRLADLLLQANRIPEAQRVLDLLRVQELDEYLQDVRSTTQTESGVDYWQIEEDLLALYQQVLADAVELQQLQEKAQTQGFDTLSIAEQQRLSELQAQSGDVQELFFAFRDRSEVDQAIRLIRESTQGQNLELDSYAQLQDELRAMPQRTVVLYPLILDDRLELVLVFPDAPPLRFPVAVTGAELNTTIIEFGQALTRPGSDIEPLAQQLYTWLIEPMEATLEQQRIEAIIYSPDGALRYIPLAALHDGENYLIQRFSLSHITADSLTDLTDAPRENQRLLAAACAECAFSFTVADSPYRFSDLPYTETEVTNLAAQFPNTSILLNQAFTLNDLQNRLGSYGIIHLATHAAFVTNAPQESFIVLGSGERISLQDIRRRWNLSHVGLVVLSACETAVGSTELGNGIEFLGLGYQLQSSGAQSVIASLWQINDGGTQVLMDAFYTALNNGYSKSAALQRAQIALITSNEVVLAGERGADYEITDLRTGQPLSQSGDLAHPYYWAPFVLIGNGL